MLRQFFSRYAMNSSSGEKSALKCHSLICVLAESARIR